MKIRCRIKPNDKHDESVDLVDGEYVVRVKAPAQEGRANEAARRVLAKHFGVAPTQVTLVGGHTSKHKTFEIVR